MNIITIRNALESYLITVSDESEKAEVMKSLVDIDEQLSLYRNPDIWKNDSYILTPDSLSDLLISTTYDLYGRFRKTNGTVTLEQYTNIVYKNCYLTELTPSCISFGFDILTDLWSDNEQFGYNNPDGSFCTD
jgi:hypothetical protein